MEGFIEGFLLQASLILALGSQNLFVIEMGIRRQYHYLIASICAFCDVTLVLLGVLGISALLVRVAELKIFVGFVGVGFLLYYSTLKFKEFHKGVRNTQDGQGFLTKQKATLMALSFTLLNPHVYIDTFFLIGGYSSRFSSEGQRLTFGVGASVFSVIWFYFLTIFSSRFSGLLQKKIFSRGLSLFSALILGYLAFKLGIEAMNDLKNYSEILE